MIAALLAPIALLIASVAMGRYSPGMQAKSLLSSISLATGATGTATSAALAPTGATKWSITAYSAVAPVGTDAALLWYKGSAVDANLLAVTPIGEQTSDNINIPFLLDSLGSNNIVVKAVGIPAATGNVVTVNLIGAAF